MTPKLKEDICLKTQEPAGSFSSMVVSRRRGAKRVPRSSGGVPEQKNLVLYGPIELGKTHMAIAAGLKRVAWDNEVLYRGGN